MSNHKEQLGMSLGSARHKLVQDLLFKMLCDLGKNSCYHCSLPMNREEFSIEHVDGWRNKENAKELFFDLDNISFSHLSCNCSNIVRKEAEHGTSTRYTSYGCRCDLCVLAKKKERRYYYEKYKSEGRRG